MMSLYDSLCTASMMSLKETGVHLAEADKQSRVQAAAISHRHPYIDLSLYVKLQDACSFKSTAEWSVRGTGAE